VVKPDQLVVIGQAIRGETVEDEINKLNIGGSLSANRADRATVFNPKTAVGLTQRH
jgi:hypothetical protein